MNEMFKFFLDYNPSPIWIRDLDLKYIYVNQAYRDFYQIGNEDVYGKNMDLVIPTANIDFFVNCCQEVINSEQYKVYDSFIKGSHKECHVFPIYDDKHNLTSLGGVVMDINERKKNELEIKNQNTILQTVIDTIPNVIFYKDNESKYIRANKTCKTFYENLGVSNIIGKTDLDINPDKTLALQLMQDDRTIIKTKEIHHTEPVMTFEDGSFECREVVKSPVMDEDNHVIGIVGISRDVTERKMFEDRLKYLSYTDVLTGVYNRTYFEDRIKEVQKESSLPIGLIMGDVNGLKLINDTFGHLEGDQLIIKIAQILKNICGNAGDIFRWGGDEFVILIPNADERTCEEMVNQINKACKQTNNTLIDLSISLGVSIANEINTDLYEALKVAEEKVYRHKLLAHNSMRSSMIHSLQKTLEAKSLETERHMERMVEKTLMIGEEMGLSLAELDELALATKLHDIGKIAISEDILMKAGKLTSEEFEIMKTHPEKGYHIIKAANGLASVAKGVLCHHEKFDGSGYPMGLAGHEIPLISRIISVVDCYDAMTNNRTYRKALKHEQAIAEIKRHAGTQFDPKVVQHFLTQYEVKQH